MSYYIQRFPSGWSVMLRTNDPARPVSVSSGHLKREDAESAMAARIREENAGADLADNHFCPSCGERGHRFTCHRCSQSLYGGGR